ncbi:MAG: hypothetical protein ACXVP0_13780, partial [Bacteroidia bacterium]
MFRIAPIVFSVLFISVHCVSQDLGKIGTRDMVKVSGGLNYASVFYNARGIPDRRQPFTWFLNGNVSVNILNLSLPFTFNYSN